jgi:hypothetical protein
MSAPSVLRPGSGPYNRIDRLVALSPLRPAGAMPHAARRPCVRRRPNAPQHAPRPTPRIAPPADCPPRPRKSARDGRWAASVRASSPFLSSPQGWLLQKPCARRAVVLLTRRYSHPISPRRLPRSANAIVAPHRRSIPAAIRLPAIFHGLEGSRPLRAFATCPIRRSSHRIHWRRMGDPVKLPHVLHKSTAIFAIQVECGRFAGAGSRPRSIVALTRRPRPYPD